LDVLAILRLDHVGVLKIPAADDIPIGSFEPSKTGDAATGVPA
jgi:hypothetical protein